MIKSILVSFIMVCCMVPYNFAGLEEKQYTITFDIPLEVQKMYFFDFFQPKTIMKITRLLSENFKELVESSEIYKILFRSAVILDIKELIFNKKIANQSCRYIELYQEYFFSYANPTNANDFVYKNKKTGQQFFCEIIKLEERLWGRKRLFRLFEIKINQKSLGNILIFFREPSWINNFRCQFNNIVKKNQHERITKVICKERWDLDIFEKMCKEISGLFPVRYIQVPIFSSQNELPHIIKTDTQIEKICVPGDILMSDSDLCDDTRIHPSTVGNLNLIKDTDQKKMYAYFIKHGFIFDLLLNIIQKKDQDSFKQVQKTYGVSINLLSPTGKTLLENVCGDRSLINFILKNGGDINLTNVKNETVFDRVIFKLIDKNCEEKVVPYYESFTFLDLHGAQPNTVTWQQLDKTQRHIQKYWRSNYFYDVLS